MAYLRKSTAYPLYIAGFAMAAYVLYLISEANYLIFHIIIESVVIMTGVVIGIIAFHTRKISKSSFFLFLGIAYFFDSILELLHTLTYRGMLVFLGENSNVATQLWLGARYMLAVSFLVAPFLMGKTLKRKTILLVGGAYALATAATIASVFWWKNFPIAYTEGVGLSDFKITSEYAISLMFASSLVVWVAKRADFDATIYRYMSASALFAIAAELSFTQYVSVYGYFNLLGHLFLALSVFFSYRALIEKALGEPYMLMFRQLQKANEQLASLADTDELTGLYNRRAALERIGEQHKVSQRFGHGFSVIMADVNGLKAINDSHGHLAGDKALAEFSRFLKENLRQEDIVGRYGGDEFVICPLESDQAAAERIAVDLKTKSIGLAVDTGSAIIPLSAEFGVAADTGTGDIMHIIGLADRKLLADKRNKKDAQQPANGTALGAGHPS